MPSFFAIHIKTKGLLKYLPFRYSRDASHTLTHKVRSQQLLTDYHDFHAGPLERSGTLLSLGFQIIPLWIKHIHAKYTSIKSTRTAAGGGSPMVPRMAHNLWDMTERPTDIKNTISIQQLTPPVSCWYDSKMFPWLTEDVIDLNTSQPTSSHTKTLLRWCELHYTVVSKFKDQTTGKYAEESCVCGEMKPFLFLLAAAVNGYSTENRFIG